MAEKLTLASLDARMIVALAAQEAQIIELQSRVEVLGEAFSKLMNGLEPMFNELEARVKVLEARPVAGVRSVQGSVKEVSIPNELYVQYTVFARAYSAAHGGCTTPAKMAIMNQAFLDSVAADRQQAA